MSRVVLKELPTPDAVQAVLDEVHQFNAQLTPSDLAELRVQLLLSYEYGGLQVLCLGHGVELQVLAAGGTNDMYQALGTLNDSEAEKAYIDLPIGWQMMRETTLPIPIAVQNS